MERCRQLAGPNHVSQPSAGCRRRRRDSRRWSGWHQPNNHVQRRLRDRTERNVRREPHSERRYARRERRVECQRRLEPLGRHTTKCHRSGHFDYRRNQRNARSRDLGWHLGCDHRRKWRPHVRQHRHAQQRHGPDRRRGGPAPWRVAFRRYADAHGHGHDCRRRLPRQLHRHFHPGHHGHF